MTILTVTAKGQVTLRKDVLVHLGVVPGERIAVDLLPDGKAVVRAARTPGSIDDFIGCLATANLPPLSLDAMNVLAAEGWAGKR